MSDLQTTPKPHPIRELMGRYTAIIKAAWQVRHQLAGPQRLADEAAFLPAALSLQDTPVHPAPRRMAWVIAGLFVLALLWASFSRVDVVAIAPGRIIVSERTKVIQPLEASVVRKVWVKDGDRVKAGQVLVELDPTNASADKASVQELLASVTSEENRTHALLQSLKTGIVPRWGSTQPHAATGLAAPDQDRVAQQLQAEWQDISAKLAKFDAEATRRKAEIATVQATIAKLEATVPIAAAREADFNKLVAQGFMSKHATQDKTRERVELESDLATQRAKLLESQSALRETEHARAAYMAETRRTLQDRNASATSKAQQLSQDQTKATQRERLTQLTAPVDGVVQQLAIHTPGGVVTPAQPLMIVVPDTAQVTAEVNVANLDIGFVNPGQSAEVKLETFLYTKYGTVPAKVEFVTADAVTDEKKGSYYPAILRLDKRDMLIDGKHIAISPGMSLTAEIKTGQRRVIEYLLSPVQRMGSESLRER